MQKYLIGFGSCLLVLIGCGQKDENTSAALPVTPVEVNVAPPVPDVGKLESVSTTAFGLGKSAGEAMSEAMKMAVLQINGSVIQSESVTAKYGLDVSLGQDSASLRASEFAEIVKQKSGGVIQNLRVLSLEEPENKAAGRFKVTIEANVAKFKPSADMQKIKVVVGPVVLTKSSVSMGDKSVPASDVSELIRQRVKDALVQTGRFAILERDFSPEITRELEMISSGQSPSAELAKLAQAASADLVWSAQVDAFDYNRYARKLKTSDRELVSYSGGWSLSQKLVNVATRQVMASESLRGTAPATEPTTMGAAVDGARVMGNMTDEAVSAIVAAILQKTFPLMVVARDGTNVVVSQGGQAVKVGGRYAVVTMGNELKDPQTGQSLGRTETPCCELVIDRVEPNLSYGHLDNVRTSLDLIAAGGLQVRGELKAATSTAQASAPTAFSSDSAAPKRPKAAKSEDEIESTAPSSKDEKW